MRSIVVSLLLVLALPGLLLPAGVVWHFCRCVARTSAPASACCQHQAEPAAQPESTCCHGRARPATPCDGMPRAQAHACGCVWLALPELREQPTPPDLGVPAPLLPPPAIEVLAWFAPQQAAPLHVWRAADVYHPPPGTDRNLPLRV